MASCVGGSGDGAAGVGAPAGDDDAWDVLDGDLDVVMRAPAAAPARVGHGGAGAGDGSAATTGAAAAVGPRLDSSARATSHVRGGGTGDAQGDCRGAGLGGRALVGGHALTEGALGGPLAVPHTHTAAAVAPGPRGGDDDVVVDVAVLDDVDGGDVRLRRVACG